MTGQVRVGSGRAKKTKQREIADIIGQEFPAFDKIDQATISRWIGEFATDAANSPPPDSRQPLRSLELSQGG
jgi:hypothetical protein